MKRTDSPWLRHLVVAVVVKLAVLVVLWWVFVHDAVVPVGSEQTAAHLIAPASPAVDDLPHPNNLRQETSP